MKSSENWNTIHKGQVGGRAGHDANTLTFMEEMKNILAHEIASNIIEFTQFT